MYEPGKLRQLAAANLDKFQSAVALVNASVGKLVPYDPELVITPEDKEPYDALSDRFIRAVELAFKFMRSSEMLMYGEKSDTLRDLLNRMEKTGLVSSVEIWFAMRDVRNRIVHDYTPEKIVQIYQDVTDKFTLELNLCLDVAKKKL